MSGQDQPHLVSRKAAGLLSNPELVKLRRITELLANKPHIVGWIPNMAGATPDETCVELSIWCCVCKRTSYVEVLEDDLLRWLDHPAQDVWSDVNLREQLMSGMHGACFDAL